MISNKLIEVWIASSKYFCYGLPLGLCVDYNMLKGLTKCICLIYDPYNFNRCY